jgi:hypothetical protein
MGFYYVLFKAVDFTIVLLDISVSSPYAYLISNKCSSELWLRYMSCQPFWLSGNMLFIDIFFHINRHSIENMSTKLLVAFYKKEML